MIFPIRDNQPSRSFPLVTVALIAINVAVFLFETTLDSRSQDFFIRSYALIPESFRASTLVTSTFLHGGFFHILGNMWFLWIYGDNVEDRLGKGRYLLFYLASGVAAGLLQLAVSPHSAIPTVGASGAIAGVMGAYMLLYPHAEIKTIIFLLFLIRVDIPALWLLIYWFALQVYSGIYELGRQSNQGGVAWFAHIGGFLAGMALIKVMKTRDPYRSYPQYP